MIISQFGIIMSHVKIIKLHINIHVSVLHFDIYKSHVNIVMLYDDMIYLKWRGGGAGVPTNINYTFEGSCNSC